MNVGDRWIYFLTDYGTSKEYFNSINHEVGIKISENNRIYAGFGDTANGRYPVPDYEIFRTMKEIFPLANERKTSKFSDELDYRINRIAEKIETSALGVLDRSEFDFGLYAEILDHFKIEAQDWVNPGRDFDVKLVELAELENAES